MGEEHKPRQPVGPHQTEGELRRVASKLEKQTDDLAGLLEAAANAEATFKLEYAKALLETKAKYAVDEPRRQVSLLEAEALRSVEEHLRARLSAEAVADAAKEAVRSMRDVLSAVQSINANVRHAAGLTA